MDISIDCASVEIESRGDGEVKVSLISIDESDLIEAISELSIYQVVAGIDDNDRILSEIGLVDIVSSVGSDDLLSEIGIDSTKSFFGLSDSNKSDLDDFDPDDVVSHFGHAQLLSEMDLDDVISHFGIDSFKHLFQSGMVIKL